MKIVDITALEILDSRGNPTVRCVTTLEDNSKHWASVPSGASTGSHEAVELRDNEPSHYGGKGVLRAVENVNTIIKEAILGKEADPKEIDKLISNLDGTNDKSKLGANAILAVSMSVTRAAAHARKIPLWKFLNEYFFNHTPAFPKLMVNIVNGGKHAQWNFDIQEFMIVPTSTTPSVSIALSSKVFHALGKLLLDRNLSTLVGDEGGYSPTLSSNEEALEIILEAAHNAGFEHINDFRLSIDAAATEFYKDGSYMLDKKPMTAEAVTTYYSEIGQTYKLLSFEDAFAEDDWEAFKNFQDIADQFHFLNIGDDVFTTNTERIDRGIKEKAANGIIIKLNQIGTVTETAEAINLAKGAGWKIVVSHRSGDTEDPFIADLAYSCAADFMKAGSMSRSERLAKYNRLLEIEKGL